MNALTVSVMNRMIRLYSGDARRIQHFTKVYTYAALIGTEEGLDETTQQTLELAALVHDCGIHRCEELYGACGGKLQEKEGPAVAKPLLNAAGVPDDMCERICFLIAHHHTYEGIDGMDWQILLEADYLVNAYEDGVSKKAVENAMEHFFKTKAGIACCKAMYQI